MTKKSSLSEQVILITGASAGIGAALAQILAEKFPGIRLILTARTQSKLEKIAQSCRQYQAEVVVIPADLAVTAQVQNLASKALSNYGVVDAVVNNAGYGQMGALELLSPETAKEQFAVNFHGALTLTQSLIPAMREQGGGKIINISSIGGRIPFPVGGLYSASKFALEAVSDVLRMELEAFNIKVSVIEFGPVKTDFFDVAAAKAAESIPTPEKTPYHAAFEKLAGIEAQTKPLCWSAPRAAQVIVKALEAKNPKPRYIAATGGQTLIFLMTKLLPTWAVDAFWKRFYGINLVAREWKNKTIKE